jgi:hypothetical protein
VPFRGTIFVFRSKRADRVKMLVYDGTGLVLIWKRLEGAKEPNSNGRRSPTGVMRRLASSPPKTPPIQSA